ncbi:cobalt-precorrin 5A hydrolase [Desulfohalovibrio reitneri]|uniref:cobalt-precorrin 5A hydrolase n=1 Tax=Desulfohalovibrio reitneri TaxID=1307759 RepID=UPI00054DE397|nr:cobalamin biosynthesis protein [Desulfohalovibrio reitneri]
MKTAVYALTRRGAEMGRRLAAALSADLHLPRRLAGAGEPGFDSLPELVARTFRAYDAHIFVAACGVAVRTIAPHLRDKYSDPAVVAVDAAGTFAVSLVSGHLGGANDLARRAAELLGAQPVVTTATDAAGAPAAEMLAVRAGLAVDGREAVVRTNLALAEGEPVGLYDPEGWLPLEPGEESFFQRGGAEDVAAMEAGVWVEARLRGLPPGHLALRPPALALGAGCRRGAAAGDILELIQTVLSDLNLSPLAVAGLASVELKRDEPGLLEAAARLGLEPVFYPAPALAAVDAPTPSARVEAATGTPSVCEAAALLLADELAAARSLNQNKELACPKRSNTTATVAVARLWAKRPAG